MSSTRIKTTGTAYRAPFPWFGGKTRAAPMIWEAFGHVKNYIEPFYGSGAVHLNRPWRGERLLETINDRDALVCNFWRAVAAEPAAVAGWVDWPVNESDLTARHIWIVDRMQTLARRMEADPGRASAVATGDESSRIRP